MIFPGLEEGAEVVFIGFVQVPFYFQNFGHESLRKEEVTTEAQTSFPTVFCGSL
jgi:hypothetical protein